MGNEWTLRPDRLRTDRNKSRRGNSRINSTRRKDAGRSLFDVSSVDLNRRAFLFLSDFVERRFERREVDFTFTFLFDRKRKTNNDRTETQTNTNQTAEAKRRKRKPPGECHTEKSKKQLNKTNFLSRFSRKKFRSNRAAKNRFVSLFRRWFVVGRTKNVEFHCRSERIRSKSVHRSIFFVFASSLSSIDDSSSIVRLDGKTRRETRRRRFVRRETPRKLLVHGKRVFVSWTNERKQTCRVSIDEQQSSTNESTNPF